MNAGRPSFDPLGRLTALAYSLNRLIARTLDPDGTSGATAIEQSIYVYEANQIVAQFDKTGTGDLAATDMSHRYLWNPQAVDQLFSDEQVHYDGGQSDFVTDDLLWTLTDHLGSVRDLATYDSGSDETTVATHRVYDAFGNETSSTVLVQRVLTTEMKEKQIPQNSEKNSI